MFNVPQFIEVEDKIVGPLTARQLGWIATGGVIFMILWATLDTSALLIGGLIDLLVFGAFAFYRPYNQPLIKFLTSSIVFLVRPKVYIWRRDADSSQSKAKKNIASGIEKRNIKTISEKNVSEISAMLEETRKR